MLRFLTSSLLVSLTAASFCGDSSIPFSLEVLPGGQPVLGCARPSCFGFAPSGHPASNTGAFYRINDHADGFVRAGVETIPPFGADDGRFYRPQTAMCEPTASSVGCSGVNQWVGGIAPLLNLTAFPTMLQCCAYDILVQSEERGTASIEDGQIVRGGEVFNGDLQVGFDYISDVAKIVRVDGTVQYDVEVRRMPCAEYADSSKKTAGGAQAFQAPNVPVEEPLPLPPAGPEGPQGPVAPVQPTDTQLLEEVVQEEAFQLPPGTQFQPPPPPQPPVAFQQPQFIPQPQAAPYYPPVAYGGGGGGGNGQWCFTDDMTVELIDGTTKRMDELEKRDWILAANEEELEYVPVEFWLHRVPEQEAEFNVFETSDGKTIKLTDKHYIFKGDCSRVNEASVDPLFITKTAVTADSVHAGDCLYSIDKEIHMHEVRVVRTSKVTQKGIYAPMTSTGRIVVNGIHASCHAIVQENIIHQTALDTVNKIYRTFFGHVSEDIVETPATLSTMLAMADVLIPKNIVSL